MKEGIETAEVGAETHSLEEIATTIAEEEVMTTAEEVMTEVVLTIVAVVEIEMTEVVAEKEDSVLQEIPITVLLLKIFLLVVAGKILKIILEPLVMFASLTLEEEETEGKWESLSTNIMTTWKQLLKNSIELAFIIQPLMYFPTTLVDHTIPAPDLDHDHELHQRKRRKIDLDPLRQEEVKEKQVLLEKEEARQDLRLLNKEQVAQEVYQPNL